MILLVSGATKTLRRIEHPLLGRLMRPGNGNTPFKPHWACDNGAFGSFKEIAFRTMLETMKRFPACRWVAAPDVVGDHRRTDELFAKWEPIIRGYCLPVAYVVQDGACVSTVPWSSIDGVFIGGTTRYKLSRTAERIIRRAKSLDQYAHVGRVNSFKRIRICHAMGADSIDGTQFSWFADRWIPGALELLEELG